MCSLIVCSISLYCYVRIKRADYYYYYYYYQFHNCVLIKRYNVEMCCWLISQKFYYLCDKKFIETTLGKITMIHI